MNEKIERIKKHIYDNRKVYLAATVGVVVGVVTVLVVIAIKSKTESVEVNMTRILSPGDNIENIMNVYIAPLGDPGNVVQCVETGTIYASQGQAARELGVTATNVGNHLHGKISDLNGFHLVILGKAGQILAEKT